MEPRTYDASIRRMLSNGSDPFRNGTDCCCIVHTSTGRYKQLLNELKAITNGWYSDSDIQSVMEEMEECCKSILSEGYRMAEITARLYVLGMIA